MERICHCTEGCCAAKAASRGASQCDEAVPLAEIVSTGRFRVLAHRLAGGTELCERVLYRTLQRRTLGRDHGAAGAVARPGQQRGAERILQAAHLMADGAGGDMQFPRGAGKAAVPGDRGESAQGGQGRNVSTHRRAI